MSYRKKWVRNTSLSFGESLSRFFSGSWGVVYSVIAGGELNTIAPGAGSFIGGGGGNGTNGFYASVVGGLVNSAQECGGFVGGGCHNGNGGCHSSILGGEYNIICSGVLQSAIGGGFNNVVQGGVSFIGGGCDNTISGGHSAVLGGFFNVSSGNFSAILGGSCNNDGGYSHAGIFGQGVNAGAANTFHVECLNAVNTPAYVPGGGLPLNTLTFWALPAPALGLAAGTKIAVLV